MTEKRYERALFIFRRDLRLEDNTGLIFALKTAKEVIPCFIFALEQIEHNPFRSDHCVQFMIESLEDLDNSLKAKNGKLYLFFGKPEKIIAQCIKGLNIEAVVVNRDYTPYSILRDQKIGAICKKNGIPLHSFDDALLFPPEKTVKSDGTPYRVFTPYYQNASNLKVPFPIPNRYKNYYSRHIAFAKDNRLYSQVLRKRSLSPSGGRKAALKILNKMKTFSDYKSMRDFPAKEGTTHLSPHLKFTTCSPREVYYSIESQLGKRSELIRSLFWRDFFTCIAYYFPEVFTGAFHTKYNSLWWNNDTKLFRLWCQGKTGFPIVDAGMREMNQTGYMQNRVRMITASFLVKDLHINWRWGEQYFAQNLIDYDPALNNGNWQWIASTGCDAQPYFRIFNPWQQTKKFDPDCSYIKLWVPELNSVPPKAIHAWYLEKNRKLCPSYPSPIIDHASEAKITISTYKQLTG